MYRILRHRIAIVHWKKGFSKKLFINVKNYFDIENARDDYYKKYTYYILDINSLESTLLVF